MPHNYAVHVANGDTQPEITFANLVGGRSPLKWVLGSAVVFGVLFATTIGSVVSTHRQVCQYIGMPAYVGVVPDHVEAAILQQVPLGSSVDQVKGFLAAHSIGLDGGSSCAGPTSRRELICKLGTDHHPWELLRETYTISFQFDAPGRLQSVAARSEVFR